MDSTDLTTSDLTDDIEENIHDAKNDDLPKKLDSYFIKYGSNSDIKEVQNKTKSLPSKMTIDIDLDEEILLKRQEEQFGINMYQSLQINDIEKILLCYILYYYVYIYCIIMLYILYYYVICIICIIMSYILYYYVILIYYLQLLLIKAHNVN